MNQKPKYLFADGEIVWHKTYGRGVIVETKNWPCYIFTPDMKQLKSLVGASVKVQQLESMEVPEENLSPTYIATPYLPDLSIIYIGYVPGSKEEKFVTGLGQVDEETKRAWGYHRSIADCRSVCEKNGGAANEFYIEERIFMPYNKAPEQVGEILKTHWFNKKEVVEPIHKALLNKFKFIL